MQEEPTTIPARTRRGSVARILAIAALIGPVSLAACDEDPVDIGHDEGDVASFELRSDSETIYRHDALDPDTMYLQDGQTMEIEIVWLDRDGDAVSLDADEHSWTFEDLSNAMTFTPSATEPWRGTLTTMQLAPGATLYGAFRIFLYHGEDEEFRTDGIVTAVEG